MAKLRLYGMRSAYDEIITTAIKRQHDPHHIIGDLLNAEIAEKQARSIKYQMTIAKLPLAKELEEFSFETTPINETLIREMATGDFLDHQRNLVLIGGTGTGKTHLPSASQEPAFEPVEGGVSSMSSISSTSLMPKRGPSGKAELRN